MGRRRRFYGHRVRRSVRVRYRRNTYIVGGGPTYHRRGIGVGPGKYTQNMNGEKIEMIFLKFL